MNALRVIAAATAGAVVWACPDWIRTHPALFMLGWFVFSVFLGIYIGKWMYLKVKAGHR